MKNKKLQIMLFGNAIILLGISCGIAVLVLKNAAQISYSLGMEHLFAYTALISPWIGIIITIFGFLIRDKE